MSVDPDIQRYLGILLEKTRLWLASSQRISTLLQNNQVTDLAQEVQTRDSIIASHEDCLQRLVLRCQTLRVVEDNSQVLAELLEKCKPGSDWEALGETLETIKQSFETLRAEDEKILKKVNQVPKQLKRELLVIENRKTGIQAYQKNRSSILDQFSRFERKK